MMACSLPPLDCARSRCRSAATSTAPMTLFRTPCCVPSPILSCSSPERMSAWLFTILHNLFRSEYRKRIREVEDTDGGYVGSLKSSPPQHSRVEFEEFRRALAKLIPDQREALILVGASGFSCEEASAICGCAVGTIKSRVHRARTKLVELLSIDSSHSFGPDQPTQAIMTVGARG